MSEPFLAEIKIVGFNFPPRGWAQCDGQVLPIAQNQSLFSLLGTTYGGDGRSTFALPELRGRTPTHKGSSINLGEKAGQENHQLTSGEIPSHKHNVKATSAAATISLGTDTLLATTGGGRRPLTPYGPLNSTSSQALMSDQVANTGQSQVHNNMQPFLSVNFVIALTGLFPSRN